ncbi:MAG: hypothetical protein ACYCWE_09060 [Eubacteriales bacterium]
MDTPDFVLNSDDKYIIEKDNAITTLYKTDLIKFLEKSGILTDFNSNKITCRYCKGVISESNLYALIPCRDHFDFCCSESDCTILFITGAGHD